ncbi:MAG: hypothetical protein ACE5LV_00550 [Candidatus Aminicenantales bacterium]
MNKKQDFPAPQICRVSSEMEFYRLIEKRLAQQGFEVLETLTLPAQKKTGRMFSRRISDRGI